MRGARQCCLHQGRRHDRWYLTHLQLQSASPGHPKQTSRTACWDLTWTLFADILSKRLAEVSSTTKSKPHLKISLSKAHSHAHVPSGAVTERSTRPGAGGIRAGSECVSGGEPNSLSKGPHPPLTARPKSKSLSAGILYILKPFAATWQGCS